MAKKKRSKGTRLLEPELPSVQQAGEIPRGMRLRHVLHGHTKEIGRLSWSPDGQRIATPSRDGTVRIWNANDGTRQILEGSFEGSLYFAAWSPDGALLASGGPGGVSLRDWVTGGVQHRVTRSKVRVSACAWSPDGNWLAHGAGSDIHIVDAASGWEAKTLEGSVGRRVISLTWSPKGRWLAWGGDDGVRLWDTERSILLTELRTMGWVFCLAWSPDESTLVSAGGAEILHVYHRDRGWQSTLLEGHTEAVQSVSFSQDGSFLASKSMDGTVRLWRTDTWLEVARLAEPSSNYVFASLAFHPTAPVLATLGDENCSVRIWDLDVKELLRGTSTPALIVRYTSAKIVLVGESNVGKSCLAQRLAEDRYPTDAEQGTTHGMRFWQLEADRLGPVAAPPAGQRRDVVLWDLGGQEEYRLVHQLFLGDASLALVLLDPTRGSAALAEVEGWNKRLDQQLGEGRAGKLLVGAKLDAPSALVDRAALDEIRARCGFAAYLETSALNGRGIAELRQALAGAIDWQALATTSRPELFQRIRDEIARRREAGEVVLALRDLEEAIRRADPDSFEAGAVAAVSRQLAAQGVLADARLASGERVLVLRIEEIERYAGSLIVSARNNARGVPALEERDIASPELPLPGMGEASRLPRLQERVVLECVAQLLVEHGVCFRHEGLLVFPTLFTGVDKSESGADLPHSSSLYYDFAGAIDNIYASLVAWLVIVKDFGRVRIWIDRAEFAAAGKGACGVRKVDRGRGFARLDLYYEDETPPKTRELFRSFVEDHLRRNGLDIAEHLDVACPSCGYHFAEDDVRRRIARGDTDVGCVQCDRRVNLADALARAGERNPVLERRTIALRTRAEESVRKVAQTVKKVFRRPDEEQASDRPLRILHMSDLHFQPEVDVKTHLRPLVEDLRDRKEGLGFDRLDYLVISGDMSHRALPEELEAAHQFTSGLIETFGLTAQRCIFVPGNHDLSWDEEVYRWQPRRQTDSRKLKPESFVAQGDILLVRDEERYPSRFRNFSRFFFHPLVQLEYPQSFEEQGQSYLFPEAGLQFLAFNSCWEIDEWFRDRASLHPGAVARSLERAGEQVEREMGSGASVLRIGVWHHPVTGSDKIERDAFLGQLRKAGVRLALHGHVHEDRADVVNYLHPRRIHVAGAGAFGAPTSQRPESTPRLYNVLEVDRDHRWVRVHTRCLRRDLGAWEGWAVWPGEDPEDPSVRRTFYRIDLEPSPRR
jgi:small GTP-binding protein